MIQKKTSRTPIIQSFLCIILVCIHFSLHGQIPVIHIEKREIALNEPLYISLESLEKEIKSFCCFPEIENFKKVNISSATSTGNVDKKITKTYIRTQVYHPSKEGVFEIKSFTMKVNDIDIKVPGATIKVGVFDKSKGELYDYSTSDERKFTELKEKAFIDISIDKSEVFVGEGFNVILALYVATDNEAPMKFPDDMGQQVEEISKQMRPANCWEENFEIDRIQEPLRLRINNKYYEQYIFYQASFFPLNTEPIEFPTVKLNMLVKNKIAEDEENPNDFSENSETISKTFYTRPRSVLVKELPPHPLKDQIAVGNYYLQEGKLQQKIKTGEDFLYEFRIIGEGNIAAIHSPVSKDLAYLDIYPPNSQQLIRRDQNKIVGAKIFSFQVIPKDSGAYALRDHFHWIFFNPFLQKYDTLHPKKEILVFGESIRNAEISSNALNPFYKDMDKVSKEAIELNTQKWVKLFAEVLIFIMLVITAIISYRR